MIALSVYISKFTFFPTYYIDAGALLVTFNLNGEVLWNRTIVSNSQLDIDHNVVLQSLAAQGNSIFTTLTIIEDDEYPRNLIEISSMGELHNRWSIDRVGSIIVASKTGLLHIVGVGNIVSRSLPVERELFVETYGGDFTFLIVVTGGGFTTLVIVILIWKREIISERFGIKAFANS